MLNIFYGRESIDKEQFIYEQIDKSQRRTLVIVPDQYTLEAEKQAFRLLQAQGLMDVEIVSMSRLGFKLLAEQGGGQKTFIDKYGRHMLLSQITAKLEEDLQVFKDSRRKNSFIEMTNNFISEMKQYNVGPGDLALLADNLEADSLLKKKLSDLELIFAEYENRIDGKYTDSEDYISLYTEKIKSSSIVQGAVIWVYGFDSFAPKSLDVLGHLMEAAEDVNVFLTYDQNCRDEEIFQLTGIVMENLVKQAELFGVDHQRLQVSDRYKSQKNSQAIKVLEEELFAVGIHKPEAHRGITLVKAANMYNEAESAAAFILHLLRDEGFRYRDIVVICNDQAVRGSIISRIFDECGISLFDDKKRSILASPIAIFVVSLIETIAYRYRTADIFKVLKTGFTSLSDEDIELLENYAIKYRIKGSMWKKPFVKGQLEYGDDGLEHMNQIRGQAMELFDRFEMIYREAENNRGFIEDCYDFLMEYAGLGDKILTLIEEQEAQGMLDLAEETSQIWRQIVGLFDQLAELTGEDAFDGKEFVSVLITGLSELEVGVLPPTADDILMGTMQRTRSGQVKAAVVIGANEGVLPSGAPEEGLFSLEELDYLTESGKEICKVERIRVLEEKLAIYRNLSKPSDYLWISYSASDEEGKETRPSEIVDNIRRIFPNLPVENDVLNRSDVKSLVGGRLSTLRHLTAALQTAKRGDKIDGTWKPVMEWFAANDKVDLDKVKKGLEFTNDQRKLNGRLMRDLYVREGKRDLTLSPSRLERFSRCPFSHFVAYGLRPAERRIFEAAGREIGDIYHRCLMKLSETLTKEKTWHQITEEECRTFVSQIVEKETSNYREGVFHFSNEERYKTKRIEDTCFYVCWALVEQIRAGKIKESLYEVPFGKEQKIAPIEIECGDEKVYIEGKIDRLDVLDQDRVKIIDYKTGKENFDKEEARGGYRLQLMLYLKAAQETDKKPAGVFYFLIGDPRVDLTGTEREKISEKISKEMRKFFRLNGIMVNDDTIISGIAGEFDGYSDIVPLRKGKEGIKATSDGFLLNEEEFAELQEAVDQQIETLCRQLADGKISITPKKTAKESPCTYCEYKGICRFDLSFPGCHYEIIK